MEYSYLHLFLYLLILYFIFIQFTRYFKISDLLKYLIFMSFSANITLKKLKSIEHSLKNHLFNLFFVLSVQNSLRDLFK